jgi:hypothetical protein
LAFLIFFRSPCFFLDGGYWQIKNDSYYDYSLKNNFLKSILYVYDYGGYFEFTRNIVSKIATYLPFFSQRIDSYFSSIIYLAIFSYVYFSKSLIFYNKNYKILIIFLILFSPAMTPEIWLTAPHIKTYFGLFTFLLLLQDSGALKGYKKIFYRFLIIFSGLSSIYASVFAPIFFLKLLLEKNKDNFLNFLCSLLPLIINIFIFLNLFNNANRFAFNFGKIENFSYNILIRPFFGSSIPKFFYNKLSITNIETTLIAIFLILLLLLTFAYQILKKKDKIILLITASFILHSAFVLIGSLYPNFVGGRYSVIPGIIILSLFIRFYQLEDSNFFKYLYSSLMFMSLLTGISEFKYFSPVPYILECKL